MANTQPLSEIVDVEVLITATGAVSPTFNLGLILGTSAVIPATERVRKYSTAALSQMLTDGFNTSSPEYICAQLYAAQMPKANSVAIGRQDLTANETPLTAMQACRAASGSWYLCGSTAAVKADHIALAEWAQTATPQVQYFFTTADADALAGASGSVGAVLTAGSYSRWQGGYATSQGGTFPNNAYTWAALMGMAMGRNTGLAGSYFKLPNKILVGIVPEPLSVAQLAAVNSQNMGAYVTYNNTAAFASYTPAKTGSGQYFDQVLGIDMAASDLQYAIANALSQNDIAVSNVGATSLLTFANSALQLSTDRGFLDGGETWAGPNVLKLQTGMAVPNGYVTQAPPITQAMRTARQIPLYACIVQTDAVQSVTIGLYVQP